ncbi:MAG: hypothetical protein R3D25_18570 [Geminicoccaceae bacterium]
MRLAGGSNCGDPTGITCQAGGTGGTGHVAQQPVVTFQGTIVASSQGTAGSTTGPVSGVRAVGISGNGGNGGHSECCNGGRGGAGGNGPAIQVYDFGTGNSTVQVTGDSSPGIFALSQAGAGGNGGSSTEFGSGGSGGTGGTGGTVTLDVGISLTTNGSTAPGVSLSSLGGNGGQAGGGGWTGSGGSGGTASAGGAITATTAGTIATLGPESFGIIAQSVGGRGGAGGSTVSLVTFAATGGSGGPGGTVSITNQAALDMKGEQASAIVAQSIGGAGGHGGSGFGLFYAQGGDGSVGGAGGQVVVTSSGAIDTYGNDAHGIQAQSIGGTGGDGGSTGGIVALGGKASATSNGGVVSVIHSNATIRTGLGPAGQQGPDPTCGTGCSHGIFVQSIGGGGGNGGSTAGWFSVGGQGGGGGTGGQAGVTITSSTIGTALIDSSAIYVQSIGGGGGHGGGGVSVGTGASIAIGGGGGSGGNGQSASALITGGTTLTTAGDRSHGMLVQSVGGGGGTGGFAVGVTVSEYAGAGVAVGGTGGGGGSGNSVLSSPASPTRIATPSRTRSRRAAISATGITGQSIGGGGGNGGFSVDVSAGGSIASLAFAIGGNGGVGGNGLDVEILSDAAITTAGGSRTASSPRAWAAAAAMAASPSRVPSISTAGHRRRGRRPGQGRQQRLHGGCHKHRPGHHSWRSGQRHLCPEHRRRWRQWRAQRRRHDLRRDRRPRCLGRRQWRQWRWCKHGDGGEQCCDPHHRRQGSRRRRPEHRRWRWQWRHEPLGCHLRLERQDPDLRHRWCRGHRRQRWRGRRHQQRQHHDRQPGRSRRHRRPDRQCPRHPRAERRRRRWQWRLRRCPDPRHAGRIDHRQRRRRGRRHGRLGGTGGKVTVSSNGAPAITTYSSQSHGVFAQSVGGSGGAGGSGVAGTLEAQATGARSTYNVSIAVGGKGGAGSTGGQVQITNTGGVSTWGNNSHGLFASSVGGSGGSGGSAATLALNCKQQNCRSDDKNDPPTGSNYNLQVGVGGNGGGGSHGGDVTITNYGTIHARGDGAMGLYAYSIGGSGGDGGDASIKSIPLTSDRVKFFKNIQVEVGGTGGSSSHGGTVLIHHENAPVTTEGANAPAVFAQSVGGGGGRGGTGAAGFTGKVAVGGGGGTAGDGGNVTVQIVGGSVTTLSSSDPSSTDPDLNAAFGIFAQSVGGGGGYGGNPELGDAKVVHIGTGLVFGAAGGSAGNGGAVSVTPSTDRTTNADNAIGIFAQSVGGGGGVAGDAGINPTFNTFLGSNGNTGNGGAVGVTYSGKLTTAGDGAHGIFAQSAGGKTSGASSAAPVTIAVTGSVAANGTDADGIQAQSIGMTGGGAPIGAVISMTVNASTVVQGGKALDSQTAGVRFLDGGANLLDNKGTITALAGGTGVVQSGIGQLTITNTGSIVTADALRGIAIRTGDRADRIANHGLIDGAVDLGGGRNRFVNALGATFRPGELTRLGTGNRLVNRGNLVIGGVVGEPVAHRLEGDLVQTATGRTTLVLHSDLDHGRPVLLVTGRVDMAGSIVPDVRSPELFANGTGTLTVVRGESGVSAATARQLRIVDSPIADFAVSFPKDEIQLDYVIDFAGAEALAGMNGNQAAVAQALEALRQVDPAAETLLGVAAAPDVPSFAAAVGRLSPEPYAANQIGTLFSSMRFSDSLLDCSADNGNVREVSERGCSWMRVQTYRVERNSTDSDSSYSDQSYEIAAGAETQLAPGWVLGGGLGYERPDMASGNFSNSDGHQLQGGLMARKELGPWLIVPAPAPAGRGSTSTATPARAAAPRPTRTSASSPAEPASAIGRSWMAGGSSPGSISP